MNQRERFEAWAAGRRMPIGRFEEGQYKALPAEFAWQAWQEAERQTVERCAEYVEAAPNYANKHEIAAIVRDLGDDE